MRTMRLVSRARSAIMAAALLLLFAPIAKAQQPRIDRLEIIEAGFFAYEPANVRTNEPDAVGGVVIQPRNMRFVPEPSGGTAQKGTSFGARFFVFGEPRNADVTLRSVWKIPPPGFKDPQSGKIYKESASEFTTQVGTEYLAGYGFNEQWEIVPGTWMLQIWQGKRKLLEQKFVIRRCEMTGSSP